MKRFKLAQKKLGAIVFVIEFDICHRMASLRKAFCDVDVHFEGKKMKP